MNLESPALDVEVKVGLDLNPNEPSLSVLERVLDEAEDNLLNSLLVSCDLIVEGLQVLKESLDPHSHLIGLVLIDLDDFLDGLYDVEPRDLRSELVLTDAREVKDVADVVMKHFRGAPPVARNPSEVVHVVFEH